MTTYRTPSHALPQLLYGLQEYGDTVPSRNGETRELMMQNFTIEDVSSPYIWTPGRHASLPAQIAETMWMLAGRDDIAWLENYLPQAGKFSDNGTTWRGAYGPRLRGWSCTPRVHGEEKESTVDQLMHVVNLLKEDPNTRRAVVQIYDPAQDSEGGKDVPCNNWIHFIARDGWLHAHVATRSNDVMWGWSGINAFEWSILLQVVAHFAGLGLGGLTFSISSLHLYDRHYDKADRILSQTLEHDNALDAGAWEPEITAPERIFGEVYQGNFDFALDTWFAAEELIRNGADSGRIAKAIKAMRPVCAQWASWLEVLWAWHTDDMSRVKEYEGSAMHAALVQSPKKPVPPDFTYPFLTSVQRLHEAKNAVYGDSWRKRGETYSILPNIARKIDRLGEAGAGDTAADTVVDLLVYLVKYHLWLRGKDADDPQLVSRELENWGHRQEFMSPPIATGQAIKWQQEQFEDLLDLIEEIPCRGVSAKSQEDKIQHVGHMARHAYGLAQVIAEAEGWSYND